MADAAYVIEVASQVSGVDATTAELDSLASMLSGSGANAAMFDDALSSLAAQLDAARATTASANEALAVGRANYAQLEAAAISAAKGVEKIEAAVATAQGAMAAAQAELDAAVAEGASEEKIEKLTNEAEKAAKNLRKASAAAEGLGDAKAAASAASAACESYATELDRLEREARDAAEAEEQLATASQNVARVQRRVNDNLGDTATKFSTFRGALGDIGGPIAEFGERLLFPGQAFVDLNEKFGRGTAIAMVAGFGLARVVTTVVGAFLKLAAAGAVAVAAIASFAMMTSNAARTLALTREAAEIMTPALRGLPWREVTDATGVAEERLRELARTLIDAKVSAADMPMALRAIATAEAALGQGGADALVAQLRAGKISAAEFAATVESKLGNVVARQMLGLEAQSARFKRSIGDAFTFDIDPALEALRTLVDLFDKSSATGRAMRAVIAGIMDPLIANAKAAAVVVEAFALGFAIGATKVYTAVKPAMRAVASLIGIDASKWKLADVLDAAASAGEWLAVKIAEAVVVIAGIAAVVAVVAVTFYDFLRAVQTVGVAIGMFIGTLAAGGIAAAKSFGSAVANAVSAVAGAAGSFVSAGANMVAGLVKGILAGTSSVISAAKQIAQAAVNAAKSVLGIASPSKVFGEIGDNTVEGFVGHVDAGRDAAHTAVAELTRPPRASERASVTSATSETSTTSTSSRTVIIQRVELPGVRDVDAFLAGLEALAERTA